MGHGTQVTRERGQNREEDGGWPDTAEPPRRLCTRSWAGGKKDFQPANTTLLSDSLRPHGLYSPWNFPGQNTGMSSLSLLQGIFPTQGSNPGIKPRSPALQVDSLAAEPQGYPR